MGNYYFKIYLRILNYNGLSWGAYTPKEYYFYCVNDIGNKIIYDIQGKHTNDYNIRNIKYVDFLIHIKQSLLPRCSFVKILMVSGEE